MSSQPCPSMLALAKLKSDPENLEDANQIANHTKKCATCQRRIEELEVHRARFHLDEERQIDRLRSAILAQERHSDAARDTTTYSVPAKKWFRPIPIAVGALVAAACVILLLNVGPASRDSRGHYLPKGAAFAVGAIAKRGDSQFRIVEGTELREGDQLGFAIEVSAPGYLTIFSVDGRGVETPFYPDTDPHEEPAPLRVYRTGRQKISGSVILDDSLGTEYVYAAFSRSLFDRSNVHETLRQIDPNLPRSMVIVLESDIKLHVEIFRIEKIR